MSTSSDTPYAELEQFNFTGGLPSSTDLAPSIIFIIAILQYGLLLPLLLWRIITKQYRTTILIRPAVFVLCRLGSLGLRAYMSKNVYGEGELIAELVMISVGPLFLIEPIISCWRLHIESDVPKADQPRWVRLLSIILRVGLFAAIITAIVGSSLIGNAIMDSSMMNTVNSLRRASMILSMVVVAVGFVATFLTQLHFSLTLRSTIWLYCLEACMIIVTVYKIAQFESSDPDAAARSQVTFWVLQVFFEL
ncbi:hypothetical protein CNBA5330 [Cryptococcus deneoformans B-3501A]|uniref:hypothetical protein n=1 Tax=Cryptococcus deneoformans (strain B-3501A) TaxID=283643 RepID=UPI000042EFFA|nr:hypothetical protein CNBA5330 [Cryptococcus neoformans var. neoformans B-3501A]EAL23189.1 hypothetical protein CNBA5330 [Cryptococcus neoformans var. neoformans B-3501A]